MNARKYFIICPSVQQGINNNFQVSVQGSLDVFLFSHLCMVEA